MLRSSSAAAESVLGGGTVSSPLGRCCRSSLLWLTAVLLLAQLYLLLWVGQQQGAEPTATQRPTPHAGGTAQPLSPHYAHQTAANKPPSHSRLSTLVDAATAAQPAEQSSGVSLVPTLRSVRHNHVLLYNARWQEAIAEAKAGGPAGELFLYATVEKALQHLQSHRPDLHIQVHKANNAAELDSSLAELLALAQSSAGSAAPHRLVGLYTQTYDLIRDSKPFEHAAISPCVYRWLDFWGTPTEQNHIRHHMHQFLTPYDNGYNQPLGLIVQPPPDQPPAAADPYSPRLCLWGKEIKYFPADRLATLQHVLDHLPSRLTPPTVHATIGGQQQPSLPAWLHNAGVQRSSEDYHAFLARCTVLIGTGDPILGPTVFQAAAHGVHYINYAYSAAKTYWMNGRMRASSQHDEAVRLLPHDAVTTVSWEGADGPQRLTDAVAAVLEREEARWKQWKAAGAEGPWRRGFIHPTHQLNNVTDRLARNLFDPAICAWHADEWKDT